MQIGARGLRGAERFRKAPASVPAPPEPARPHWCERHFHHKLLHCMSMLRPAWDPRTAAPGLAAGVGGCPGLAWGRVKGVGKRVSYLCKGQRQLRETKKHPGCCHFRRWWWWSPPSGPLESSRPNLEDLAPTDPKSACPIRDPSFPLLIKLSPPVPAGLGRGRAGPCGLGAPPHPSGQEAHPRLLLWGCLGGVELALLHSVLQGQICQLPQMFLDFLLLRSSSQ